jgi:hypothetical protein
VATRVPVYSVKVYATQPLLHETRIWGTVSDGAKVYSFQAGLVAGRVHVDMYRQGGKLGKHRIMMASKSAPGHRNAVMHSAEVIGGVQCRGGTNGKR